MAVGPEGVPACPQAANPISPSSERILKKADFLAKNTSLVQPIPHWKECLSSYPRPGKGQRAAERRLAEQHVGHAPALRARQPAGHEGIRSLQSAGGQRRPARV